MLNGTFSTNSLYHVVEVGPGDKTTYHIIKQYNKPRKSWAFMKTIPLPRLGFSLSSQ